MVELKEAIDKIKSMDIIKSWITDVSPNTRVSYYNGLAEFCMVNEVDPHEMLKIIHMEEEERVPAWNRSINKWFDAFDEHCKENKRTKSTRDNRRTVVNAFISYHGLPKHISKGGRRRFSGLKEPNKREVLKKEDIKKLLNASKTWKMRAMILAQLSSGLTGIDLINLKIEHFEEGIKELYDDNGHLRRVCMLHLVRQKTDKEFTTFFSEEAVLAIEKYLELERVNPKPDEALFSSYKKIGNHMKTTTLQTAYRNLNRYLGWEQEERGRFRKATSHMMRKYFNTQLINAGMPEEIREHMMGHVISNKVQDAYFLADPQELLKVYLKFMDYVTIEKREVNSDELINDHVANNAKINELEDMLREMKKKLDKVTEST